MRIIRPLRVTRSYTQRLVAGRDWKARMNHFLTHGTALPDERH